jgi:hypothetical protein
LAFLEVARAPIKINHELEINMQKPGWDEDSRSEREFLESLDDVPGQYPLRVTVLRRPLDHKVLSDIPTNMLSHFDCYSPVRRDSARQR